MGILSTVKNAAFGAAVTTILNYLEKDSETNIPKAMELMDKVLPEGWYESQRSAFRKVIADKDNWYQLILKAWQLDEGVRKTLFQNFIVNSALKGSAIQDVVREREKCNVPWAVLLDPTSACNLHCTGCWAAVSQAEGIIYISMLPGMGSQSLRWILKSRFPWLPL